MTTTEARPMHLEITERRSVIPGATYRVDPRCNGTDSTAAELIGVLKNGRTYQEMVILRWRDGAHRGELVECTWLEFGRRFLELERVPVVERKSGQASGSGY